MSTKRFGEGIAVDITDGIIWLFAAGVRLTARQIQTLLPSKPTLRDTGFTITQLKRRGHVAGNAKAGYYLTINGIKRLDALRFEAIINKEPWDKQWRLISYDIPETNRTARDSIRRLIKQLGCKQLQLSIWAHPYPCLKQFETIRRAYGLDKHLYLFEVPHAPQFSALFEAFHKTYPNLSIKK